MNLKHDGDNNGGSSNLANINNGRWTDEEHERFCEALKMYGKDWNQIQEHIGTRTSAQIRSHAQKYFSKLFKEGKLDVLEMFDQFLSGVRDPDNEDSDGKGMGRPMMKTKTITKNYGTRLGKPTTKVRSIFAINYAANLCRRKKCLAQEPCPACKCLQ